MEEEKRIIKNQKRREIYNNNKDIINKKVECIYCKCFIIERELNRHKQSNKHYLNVLNKINTAKNYDELIKLTDEINIQ